MAICFTVDVMCDGDVDGHACGAWTFGTVQYHSISGTRKIAREGAKKEGWVHKNGKDYCPGCTERKKIK